jgi:hypothetical protein
MVRSLCEDEIFGFQDKEMQMNVAKKKLSEQIARACSVSSAETEQALSSDPV